MAPTPKSERWRSIAEQASKEMDAGRLMDLVQELCNEFDEGHKIPQSAQGKIVTP